MAIGLTCPTGQSPTLRYDGTTTCCGGDPASDPCSYLNTPQFQATQNAAIAEDIATSGGVNGPAGSWLALVGMYPQDIQFATNYCFYNPGQAYTAPGGTFINCPSGSVPGPAGNTSNLSASQLAAMLESKYGASIPNTLANAPTPLSNYIGSGVYAQVPTTGNANPSSTAPTSVAGSMAITTPGTAGTSLASMLPSNIASLVPSGVTDFLNTLSPLELGIGVVGIVGIMMFMSKR